GLGLLLAACGDDSDSGDSGGGSDDTTEVAGGCEADVCMEGIAYTEANVTVAAGDTVTWTNLDNVPHTVTAGTADAPDPATFDSGNIGQGESFELTLDEAGEVTYYCMIHPQMQATVTVE
ncbi:MAG: plastocyanin/azurin family copper-binding protein, partial [Actinomycetota bacterium]